MSELLSTDVLAVLSDGDYIFVGIGYTLRMYQKSTNSLISHLDIFYPDKIHGIIKGPANYLAVFGGKNLGIIEVNSSNKIPRIKLYEDVCRFNDWIITVGWWSSANDFLELAILSAHNSLCLYNWTSKQAKEFQCEEKCILYGGSVINDFSSNFVVLAGTVFQEIVLWAVNDVISNKEVPVLHRLRGHNGVIFSVTFDPATCLISSTSDDRTIRLWSVKINDLDNHISKWKNATISLAITMFGHTARVWRALIRKNFVLSIGEDSLLCIWTIDGKLIKKIEAHHGAPIWSIDASENGEFAITGGGDGAVHIWPLSENTNSQIECVLMKSLKDVPKHVGFLSSGTVVVITQNGKMITHKNEANSTIKSVDVKLYSNYVVMQISPNRKLIALASLSGFLTIYEDNDETEYLAKVSEEKVMDSKILSMHWLSDDSLLLCGTEGRLRSFKIVNSVILVESQHILPHSRERWTTAATIHKDLLICGDRAGSIHLFRSKSIETTAIETDNTLINDRNFPHLNPFQSFLKIHGRLGVHSCKIISNKLLTTGRDGTLRFYELRKIDDQETINALHIDKMPMDWVSTTLKTESELYVLGFKEVDFVVYSTLHQRVLARINCGGGHRSWDYVLENEFLNFIYIRDKQINLVKCRLDSLASPALENGFHTKEVYCIERVQTILGHNILLSGGEDRNLLVTHITNSKMRVSSGQQFHTVASLSGHLSSIRALALINLKDTIECSKNLVFSGGGRAQLKIWFIEIRFDQNMLDNNNSKYVELASHMLRGTDQQQRKTLQQGAQQSHYIDPETRYMNINVHRIREDLNLVLLLVACSDGFLRIFSYNIATRIIFLRTAIPYGNRCIIKTHLFDYNENRIAMTMATDGIVNFWCLNETIDTIVKDLPQDQLTTTLSPFERLKLHQCGINSYDIKLIKESEYILATGGDDNLLCLRVLKIKSEIGGMSLHEIASWDSSSAHCTQITGIILDDRGHLISIGIDQKVLTFKYVYNDGKLEVSLMNEITTSIADVQGMITCYTEEYDKVLLCIYGKGFELMTRPLQFSAVN